MMKKLIVASLMACLTGTMMAADNVAGRIYWTTAGTNWTMNVKLNNAVAYNAFQMDVEVPHGMSIASVDKVDARLVTGSNVTIDGSSVSTAFVTDFNTISTGSTSDVVRVICYNMGNNAITGNSGDIIKVNLQSSSALDNYQTAKISNITFVNSDLAGVSFDVNNVKMAADTNNDKLITVADIQDALNNFNTSVEADDVNGDGQVTVADIQNILNQM